MRKIQFSFLSVQDLENWDVLKRCISSGELDVSDKLFKFLTEKKFLQFLDVEVPLINYIIW